MGKYIPDQEIFDVVNSFLKIADEKMEEFIPEDTFDLQKDRKIERANRVGNRIEGAVFIDPNGESSDYAEFVEFGDGSTKRYYKNTGRINGGTPFFVSNDGAQFIRKTARYLQDNIL